VTSKNGKTSSPVGFVTFSTRAGAEFAKQDLQQGVRFDPDLPQTIRLEFARSNTKVSRPKQPSPPVASSHPGLAVHSFSGMDLGSLLGPGVNESWPHHLSYAEVPVTSPLQFGYHPMSHAAAVHATMQAMHAQLPPAHLVAASPAMNSPVGSEGSLNKTGKESFRHF